MSQPQDPPKRDRGQRPEIDPATGEVRGSGSGAGGGGSSEEDYDLDSPSGAGDDPPGGPRPFDQAAHDSDDQHET